MAAMLPPPAPIGAGTPLPPPRASVAPLVTSAMVPPPPGWYLDPWRIAHNRWWDGRSWTGYVWTGVVAPAPEPELPSLPVRAGVTVVAVLAATLLVQRGVVDALQQHHVPLLVVLVLSVALAYGPALATALVVVRRYPTTAPAATAPGDPTSVWHAVAFRVRKVDVGWGVLTWLAIVVGNRALLTLLNVLHVPMSSNVRFGDRMPARNLLIASTLVAVVAAPFVEEIIFRGVLLRSLRSVMSARLAIPVQALLFGLAHVQVAFGAGNIGLVLLLSWAGAALGFAAHHFRRLGPSVCAHASLNAMVFLVVWLAPEVLRTR